MRKRILGYLSMTVLLVLVLAAPALSSSYFIYEQYGGTWHDANKTASPNDDLMCWAAAASNILSWGNWGASGYNTETSIFQYLVDHWTNKTGYPTWAWSWWFNGSPPAVTTYAYPDVPGGDFYPTLNIKNYLTAAAGGNIMNTINTYLHQGKGVGMVISKGSTSHAVTVWGYSTTNTGTYSNIYITDSDDGTVGLVNYPLIWQNNAWYMGGGYTGWRIGTVQALGYLTNPGDLNLGALNNPAGAGSEVPITPTWLLFGTGAFSMYLMGRRRGPGKPEPPAN
jgi:hypothetical protein